MAQETIHYVMAIWFLLLTIIESLQLQISSSASINFSKPELISNTEWPDKFVLIESNFIGGDLGSATFIATNTQNSTKWTQAYIHSSTNPAIGFAFSINSTTITNLGTFPAIPSNTTVTNITSSNYDHFYEGSSQQLLYSEYKTDTMIFQGLPYGISNSKFAKGLRFSGSNNIILNDGSYLQTAIIFWGGNPKYAYSTSIVAFISTDLKYWNFLSIIANASQYPESEEGPNEHDISYLADGKTLYCLIRLDAGDGPTTHSYKYYASSMSMDNGKTWSKLQIMDGMGCARPRLRLFKMGNNNNILIASGGRMRNDNTSDILMWINQNGDGINWDKMISISYIHNKLLIGDTNMDKYLFDKNVNSTTYSPRETNSYTSLIDWDRSYDGNIAYGVITYDQMKNGNQYSFGMNFMLQLN